MRPRVLLGAFAFVLALVSAGSAQEPPPEFELPDVVSPGRRPQPAAASPASVSVLTAADLRRLGVRTVGEALAYVPESVARAYGGPGGLITPSIRGSSAEQVLVLLDGVPLNGVFAGTVDLSTIPVDDVERIEILRGPFSAIYGSGALGGVISITTRGRARPAVAVGGGSLGVFGASVTTGGDARLSIRYDSAAGDRPNSDLRGAAFSLRTGGAAGARTWDLSLFGAASARGTPGATAFPTPLARQEDRRFVAAFTASRAGEAASDRLRLSLHYDGLGYRDPTFAVDDRHDGFSWSGEWQRVLRRGPGRVTAVGLDAQAQHLSSSSVGGRGAVVAAAYIQDDRTLSPRLLLSTGLRADWHSAWGLQANPRAGIVYFVRPDLRLRLAAGRAFRGPTFADLYFPFDGFVVGNPSLRPERAWSIDAGVEAALRRGWTARATVFWSDVRDLIIYVPDEAFVFSPQNVGRASILGASVEVDGALLPRWAVRAALTGLLPTDAATGLDLPNRPRAAASLAVTHLAGDAVSLTASAAYVGERYADTANQIRLPAYVTASLVVQARISSTTDLRATVHNLFDARYEPVQGYPAPGRRILAELVWRR